jgi:hypothetical protein
VRANPARCSCPDNTPTNKPGLAGWPTAATNSTRELRTATSGFLRNIHHLSETSHEDMPRPDHGVQLAAISISSEPNGSNGSTRNVAVQVVNRAPLTLQRAFGLSSMTRHCATPIDESPPRVSKASLACCSGCTERTLFLSVVTSTTPKRYLLASAPPVVTAIPLGASSPSTNESLQT